MTKALFKDLDIGTFFKIYGLLMVKINYSDDDDNVFNFSVNYVDFIESDDEVEIVEKVEIKIPE